MLYSSILEKDATTQEHFLLLNGGDWFKYKFSLEHYFPMSPTKLKKLKPIFDAALDARTAHKVISVLLSFVETKPMTPTQRKALSNNLAYFDKYTN